MVKFNGYLLYLTILEYYWRNHTWFQDFLKLPYSLTMALYAYICIFVCTVQQPQYPKATDLSAKLKQRKHPAWIYIYWSTRVETDLCSWVFKRVKTQKMFCKYILKGSCNISTIANSKQLEKESLFSILAGAVNLVLMDIQGTCSKQFPATHLKEP